MDGKPTWHKSTYSDGGSNCVEVRGSASGAAVRDTQNRELGHLSVPPAEWTAFLRLTR
ncbi:DUF397 domain-containing protein [Nocardiopsis terrae]